MAAIQHIDVFGGEDREVLLIGRDAFGLPVDLTGMSVLWHVGRSPFRPDNSAAIFSKPGTVLDAPMGVFTVPVSSSDTADLNGDFEHQAIASDATTRAVICQGRFRIRATLS